jgi:hypothetical protein
LRIALARALSPPLAPYRAPCSIYASLPAGCCGSCGCMERCPGAVPCCSRLGARGDETSTCQVSDGHRGRQGYGKGRKGWAVRLPQMNKPRPPAPGLGREWTGLFRSAMTQWNSSINQWHIIIIIVIIIIIIIRNIFQWR